MADLDVQKFTAAVVGVIVVVIIGVTVLIPIIADNQVAETVTNSASLNAIINIIPLLVFVGIIIAIVTIFLGKRQAQ